MAKINTKAVEKARANPGTRITIGHNRQIEFGYEGRVTGWLHGHRIFDWLPRASILILDTCGYRTVTTRNAFNDFCAAVGVNVKVSFANDMTSLFSWSHNIRGLDAWKAYHDGEISRMDLDALTLGCGTGIRYGMAKADSPDHRHAAEVIAA